MIRAVRRCAIAMIAVTGLITVAGPVRSQENEDARYALLVGVGDYGKDAPALPAVPHDIAAMRDLLINSFGFSQDRIVVLMDSTATRSKIVDQIERHLGRAASNELAFLYFVGHGVRMPANVSVQDSEPSGVDQALRVAGKERDGNILLDDEVATLLQRLPSRRVVAVVDACYSGSVAFRKPVDSLKWAIRPPVPEFQLVQMGRGVSYAAPSQYISDGVVLVGTVNGEMGLAEVSPYMIMAGTSDENKAYSGINWPTSQAPRSVFSYHLGRQLRSAAADWTVRDVSRATRRAVLTDRLCREFKACQRPAARGIALDGTLTELLRP